MVVVVVLAMPQYGEPASPARVVAGTLGSEPMTAPEPPAPEPPDAPTPDAHAPKHVWRAWARARRAALAADPARAAAVREGVRSWLAGASPDLVVLYLAFGDEVALTPLLDGAPFEAAVTRTHPDGSLTLHRFDPAHLERHRLGFDQPRADAPEVALSTVDLVLLPGLCFDAAGTRLGYGRGYFDRWLPGLRPDAARVGVTFHGLVVPRLPREAHDVPMTHLATERGVRRVSRAPLR